MKYTLYVDESGQSGIKKIKSDTEGGASRYMTMGGVLVPDDNRPHLRKVLAELTSAIGKADLHCSKLNHNQIVKFAQTLAKEEVVLFGVISLKETLGTYKDDIGESDKKYYNKCAQYLLEKVGLFLEQAGCTETDISIRFENGGFDYDGLRGLIYHCRKSPQHQSTKMLKNINQNSIIALAKEEEQLLQLGDLVAHALFKCVDDAPSTYGVFETRYLSELRTRFFFNKTTRKICGTGVFPVHKLQHIKADAQVARFLQEFSPDT